jgi:Zn-dependent peptidase ImmA (M78 family)
MDWEIMTLNIFGKKIRVLKKKNLIRDFGARGAYYSKLKLIVIDDEQVGTEHLQTLLHEMVHAVIDRCGIDQAGIGDGVEEIICESVATALIENFTLKPRK